jgi:hypothetical protein
MASLRHQPLRRARASREPLDNPVLVPCNSLRNSMLNNCVFGTYRASTTKLSLVDKGVLKSPCCNSSANWVCIRSSAASETPKVLVLLKLARNSPPPGGCVASAFLVGLGLGLGFSDGLGLGFGLGLRDGFGLGFGFPDLACSAVSARGRNAAYGWLIQRFDRETYPQKRIPRATVSAYGRTEPASVRVNQRSRYEPRHQRRSEG